MAGRNRAKSRFHVATSGDILSGKVTDVYFSRAREILKRLKVDKRVKAEFIVKTFPRNYEWGVLAGIEEAVGVLRRLGVNVRAMPEGTVFYPEEPVLEIEGMYSRFGIFETSLLGLICQASGVATKAARCRKLAGDREIMSFGARRMHPALAPMIERSAYIGGCDAVAVVGSAALIDQEPAGTIPHALIILLGSGAAAVKAFDRVIDPRVRRVALVDTYGDEKFESIAAAEALGKRLFGVRLDTPASRRGNFRRIIQEVRWELDLRGHRHVKIIVSGGIDEKQLVELNDVVDGYGIGTSISNAPVLDFAMDIVEVEGRPNAKRGKKSGSKSVYRCRSCRSDRVVPFESRSGNEPRTVCDCGGKMEEILIPLLRRGKVLADLRPAGEIRRYVLSQISRLPALEP